MQRLSFSLCLRRRRTGMVFVTMRVGKNRNSNIELLRIVCMSFIVMGHFKLQGAFYIPSLSVNSFLITVLGSGSRIAVNIFLMIGVWFMVDADFSGKRIVALWSQTAFYTYFLTTFLILIGYTSNLKIIFRGYLPFICRGLWFTSAYLTLIFVSPFLRKVFFWNPHQQALFLVVLFSAVCLVSTLPESQTSYLCDSLWFWFVYLLIGYFKREVYGKHREQLEKWKWPCLIAGGILYMGLCIAFYFGELYGADNKVIGLLFGLAAQYLDDIKTLPNVLCAFLFFNFTILCKAQTNAVIQKIAAASFSVYIIHQSPDFGHFLMWNIYHSAAFRGLDWSVLYLIFVPLSLFAVVSVVDIGRKAIERRWMRSNLIRKITDAIDGVYRKAGMIES